MSDRDFIALICHEARTLRLRGAELESRTIQTLRDMREAVAQRRALVEQLREKKNLLLQAVGDTSRPRPVARKRRANQRGSAR